MHGWPRCAGQRCAGRSSRRAASPQSPTTSLRWSSSCSTGLAGYLPLDPVNYEPRLDESVYARAQAAGVDPIEHMYDLLLADGGTAFYALLGSNFVNGTLDVCREMLLDPNTVSGLGDAGAHVNLISDCSASTFHLTHWARDRPGDRLPIELLVHKLSGANAALYGFDDRGSVAVGARADLNVIDFDRLRVLPPVLRHDLPTGVSRILQPAEGYLATLVNGVITRRHDADTGSGPVAWSGDRLGDHRCSGLGSSGQASDVHGSSSGCPAMSLWNDRTSSPMISPSPSPMIGPSLRLVHHR